jgi:hypothetical protein
VKKIYSYFSGLAIFILVQFSCTKIDTTDLGSELIPAVDNVNTFDTTLLVESNNLFLPDSTRLLYTEDHALGQLTDPAFGKTTADMYFAISAPSYGTYPFVAKDSIIQIDSVILQIAYSSAIYGDSTVQHTYQVSEIGSNLTTGFIYPGRVDGYRIDTLPTTGFQTIGNLSNPYVQTLTDLDKQWVLTTKPSDTTRISNVMRIPLNISFGTRLTSYDTTQATGAAYRSDSLFKRAFNGFAIKCISTTGQGALAYFAPSNTNTKLIVYYRQKKLGSGDRDTTSVVFPVSPYASGNLINRTPAGAYAANIANGTPNDQLLYIQSTPGSYATIRVPGLAGLNNRVIHRAELIVERETTTVPSNDIFTPPPYLFVDALGSVKPDSILAIPNYDFRAETGGFNVGEFGGFLQNDQYKFNLSRYVQGIVTRHEPVLTLRLHSAFYPILYYRDPQFGLSPYGFNLSSKIAYGRVVVKGGGNADPAKRLRLRIIYSKI